MTYFRNLKKEYLLKNPREKWEFVRDVNIVPLSFLGFDFMSPNFELDWKAAIPVFVGLDYIISMFYAMFYYKNEPLRAMQSTPQLAVAIPVSSTFDIMIEFIDTFSLIGFNNICIGD